MSGRPAPQRLRTLDAVRGVAVMGIVLLNVIDFAMPGYAEVDPHFYGGANGANWWEWAVVYVVAEGKMRGLFTMMFGASTVLVAARAAAAGESPARVHYARMGVLLAIGMVHAYLIWSGDILVLYALCGALAFAAWRWRPRLTMTLGIALLAFKLVDGLTIYGNVDALRAAATQSGAAAKNVAAWQRYVRDAVPSRATIAGDLASHRGSYADALHARIPETIAAQTEINPEVAVDTLGLMLIGMALLRLGFFSGEWSRRAYWFAAAPISMLWLGYIPLVAWLDRSSFSPVTLIATETVHLTLLRPLLSLGYAALVILFVRSGRAAWLADRLAAAGRTAFSNYLGTSIILTLLFDGYGLGWYGYLQRWQCLIVVALVWAIMLAWSQAWLDRFAYGPFEWLWRSGARGKLQPFARRTIHANASQ